MTEKITRESVLKELKSLLESNEKILNSEIEREENEEYREPLSIEREEIVKVLLSWGGGEDGFKLRFKDKEILSGVYYCADWGEYQEVELSEDELKAVFDFYFFGEYPSN